MEVGKTCCPPQRRVLSAIVQQAVAQLPRCLNSVELTRHDSAQGPSIWCQIGVKGGRFRRFCRFCRLLTTLPSITYVFYSSMAWKRSMGRAASLPSPHPRYEIVSSKAAIWKLNATTFGNPRISGAVKPPQVSSTPFQPQILIP